MSPPDVGRDIGNLSESVCKCGEEIRKSPKRRRPIIAFVDNAHPAPGRTNDRGFYFVIMMDLGATLG